jgi:hypothetical protein
LRDLLGSAALRRRLGERARAVIAANQGATQRTLERIAPLLGVVLPVGAPIQP